MGLLSRWSSGRTRARAEQLLKSFKTTDLHHVYYILGLEGAERKGFTYEIALRVVLEHPELADKIIRRKFSSWK